LYGAFALVLLGHGGVTRIAAAAHSTRPTVARGKHELAFGARPHRPHRRIAATSFWTLPKLPRRSAYAGDRRFSS
jgi:hypothetical protein